MRDRVSILGLRPGDHLSMHEDEDKFVDNSQDDIDMYELKVLDDPDSPTTVDLDSSVDEIRSDFHIESAT
ncbi:unnamed protein product, partial [Didymodactylos carnosus]